MNTRYCTIEELVTLLRVPQSWLYEQARQRRIPHLKPGKRLLFVEAEVVAWFEETYRRAPLEVRSPSSLRPRRRTPARQPRAPNTALGSRRSAKPSVARVSANGPTVIASRLPEQRPGEGQR